MMGVTQMTGSSKLFSAGAPEREAAVCITPIYVRMRRRKREKNRFLDSLIH
jgi:hypothetical protein